VPEKNKIIQCYLGLGSNIGNARKNIDDAITLLTKHTAINIIKTASYYLTKAWGNTEQGDFVNTVVEIETSLSAQALLVATQGIEKQMGRVKSTHWGPRIIDIDILLYGDNVVKQQHLKIPHPYLTARGFVLMPLYQLNPRLFIPGKGKIVEFIDENGFANEIIEVLSL
jgi:2-amino-4-hydroxy-6-hydroxymethyldihydropteridine diphosphokinase